MLAGKAAFVRPDIGEMDEGLERPCAAQRSRDDVPVDLSDVHRAAGRSGRVPRDDGAAEGWRWPIGEALPDAAFEDALNAALTPEPPARAAADARRSSRR